MFIFHLCWSTHSKESSRAYLVNAIKMWNSAAAFPISDRNLTIQVRKQGEEKNYIKTMTLFRAYI